MDKESVDLSPVSEFAGFTLDYRRNGTDWPGPFRCRVVANKNERQDYRVTAFGNTANEAVAEAARLLAHVKDWHGAPPISFAKAELMADWNGR